MSGLIIRLRRSRENKREVQQGTAMMTIVRLLGLVLDTSQYDTGLGR